MRLIDFIGCLMASPLIQVYAYPRSRPSSRDNLSDDDHHIVDLSQFGDKIFGTPDVETGKLVAAFDAERDKVNPEELGNYLEGDMLIPQSHVLSRNALTAASKRWPGGIVPYVIGSQFDAKQRSLIGQAINEYHRKTCIRFKQRTNEEDYVIFTMDNTGCHSSVGRIGGAQAINLQSPGCVKRIGTIIHEMMHSIGFTHEQNRPDRSNYIRVNMRNIQPGHDANFRQRSASEVSSFGVEYDYGSVMHYSSHAFSRNGEATIIATRHTRDSTHMGQRIGFSSSDVYKVNKLYKCNSADPSDPALPDNHHHHHHHHHRH